MATQIPVLVVTSALRVLHLQARARTGAQKAEAAREIARLKVQASLLENERQRALQDRLHQREAETILQLAELSKGIAEAQISAVMEIFHGVKDILLRQQTILGQEKAALSAADLTGQLDGAQYVLRMKRQKDIDRELSAITGAAMQLGDTAFQIVSQLRQNIDQKTRLQIEKLKDVTPE